MPVKVGSFVHVRYEDHVLFRNTEPKKETPIIQEVWGLLDCDTENYIRLVVARYQEPGNNEKQETKATGLVILKKTILEMHRIG